IGAEGFRNFLSDRRLWDLSAILETPLDNPDDDRQNLWKIVELAAESGAVGRELLESMPTGPQDAVGAMPKLVSPQAGRLSRKPKPKAQTRRRTLRSPRARTPAGRLAVKLKQKIRARRSKTQS